MLTTASWRDADNSERNAKPRLKVHMKAYILLFLLTLALLLSSAYAQTQKMNYPSLMKSGPPSHLRGCHRAH